MASLLHGANQRRGMPLKLATGRRQRRARLVANKQYAAKQTFKGMNPRADGRLADVQPLGGGNEIAGSDDRQEGSGKFGVHGKEPAGMVTRKFASLSLRVSKLLVKFYHTGIIRLPTSSSAQNLPRQDGSGLERSSTKQILTANIIRLSKVK